MAEPIFIAPQFPQRNKCAAMYQWTPPNYPHLRPQISNRKILLFVTDICWWEWRSFAHLRYNFLRIKPLKMSALYIAVIIKVINRLHINTTKTLIEMVHKFWIITKSCKMVTLRVFLSRHSYHKKEKNVTSKLHRRPKSNKILAPLACHSMTASI